MEIRQTHALVTRKPRVSCELGILAAVENLKAIEIEKTIILAKDDYINFVTDLTVERLFLRKHTSLCKIDDKGIWHCLLVVFKGLQDGILVMADEDGFPNYAVQFWRRISSLPLLQQHSSSIYSGK